MHSASVLLCSHADSTHPAPAHTHVTSQRTIYRSKHNSFLLADQHQYWALLYRHHNIILSHWLTQPCPTIYTCTWSEQTPIHSFMLLQKKLCLYALETIVRLTPHSLPAQIYLQHGEKHSSLTQLCLRSCTTVLTAMHYINISLSTTLRLQDGFWTLELH